MTLRRPIDPREESLARFSFLIVGVAAEASDEAKKLNQTLYLRKGSWISTKASDQRKKGQGRTACGKQ